MADRLATALWIVARGRAELRSAPLPAVAADKVLIETQFSAISRGTERLVFEGQVPESERERMHCPFQEGVFPFPVKYGYAAVGRVAEGPDALRGRCVFVLYPHQDRFVVPAGAVVPLPAGLPPERAVLAANVETALNGVWDAAIGPGMSVCVVGAGVVGLLAAWLVQRMPGTDLIVIDTDARKAAICTHLGLPFAITPPPDGAFDVVVHASGRAAGLATALSVAGQEGLVLEMSWFGEEAVPLSLGGAFHAKRLTLRSSQVGAVSPCQRPRWSHRRRLEKALALLADPVLDALISGESAFAAMPAALPHVFDGTEPVLCHRIRYQS